MSPKETQEHLAAPKSNVAESLPGMFMPWATLIGSEATPEDITEAINQLAETFQKQGMEMSQQELMLHISCAQLAILSQINRGSAS